MHNTKRFTNPPKFLGDHILMCLVFAFIPLYAFASNPHDSLHLAKKSWIYNTIEFEALSFEEATSASDSTSCDAALVSQDIFEHFTTPQDTDSILITYYLLVDEGNRRFNAELLDSLGQSLWCHSNITDTTTFKWLLPPSTRFHLRYSISDTIMHSYSISTALWSEYGEQRCPTSNLLFQRQSQIDSFRIIYPRCYTCPYDIRVEQSGTDIITNLYGLQNVTHLDGYLVITANPGLHDLTGLESLEYIQKGISITGSSLHNLDGLTSLRQIDGLFYIMVNDIIQNTNPLPSLEVINGPVFITGNRNLRDIDFLQQVDSINGWLTVTNNRFLGNLDGLQSLQYIAHNLSIQFNSQLHDIQGLQSLNRVDGNVVLTNNGTFTDLQGLSSLSRIGGNLNVDNQQALLTLEGLENLITIGTNLTIRSNPNLLSFRGLQNIRSVGGNLHLSNNNHILDMYGLEGLQSIDGFLCIEQHDLLQSLSGLEHLNGASIDAYSPGYKDLTIKANPALSVCNISPICEVIDDPTVTKDIKGNLDNCADENTLDTHCSLAVLPVEWIYVKAEEVDEAVWVTWHVGHEINVSHYDIYLHAEQTNWEKVGTTNYNAYTGGQYELPLSISSAGVHHLYIESVDHDGTKSRSAMIRIDLISSGELRLYPNPAKDFIHMPVMEETSWSIQTLTGVQVLKGSKSQAEIGHLPEGTYIWRSGDQAIKFVKL